MAFVRCDRAPGVMRYATACDTPLGTSGTVQHSVLMDLDRLKLTRNLLTGI